MKHGRIVLGLSLTVCAILILWFVPKFQADSLRGTTGVTPKAH